LIDASTVIFIAPIHTHNKQQAINWTLGAKELTVYIGDWRSRSLENEQQVGGPDGFHDYTSQSP
jgi:hypothetical protein